MHPLSAALRAAEMTQVELAHLVTSLRIRRANGTLIKLRQNSVSQMCAYKRGISRDVAKAIVIAMKGRARVDAGTLVLAGTMHPPHRQRKVRSG
jgi:hypothetical protein